MKALLALAMLCAPLIAHADTFRYPPLKELADSLNVAWIQQDGVWWLSDPGEEGMKPPPCQKIVDKLVKENIADTTIFPLGRDIKDYKAGPHTFAEYKASCTQVAYLSKAKAFTDEAFMAINFRDEEFAKRCIDRYDEVIKAGVKPTEIVPTSMVAVRGGPDVEVSGSIENIRIKFCDPLYKKVAEERAKREAPYRAVLKGDKLDAALSGRFWMLPGKVEGANNPKRLAANNVWFYEMEPSDGSCANGKTIILYRWQFDQKTSKFLKATEKQYCGTPPASAYR